MRSRCSCWSSLRFSVRSSSPIRSSRSSSASSWRSSRLLRSIEPILARELGGAADDSGPGTEPLEQALLRARAGLERLEPPRDAELRRGDADERLGRVGEGPEPDAVGAEPAQSRVHLRARAQVDGRVLLGEALEQRAPVPDDAVE